MDELDFVGVDKEGQLYWNGEPIKIKRKIELGNVARGLAFAAAAGTFGVFLIELYKLV